MADFQTEAEFLERYPGDDVVDFLSFDMYHYGDTAQSPAVRELMSRRLDIIDRLAGEKGKVAALAETGYERTPDARWWTGVLNEALKGKRISYVLLWRNAGRMSNGQMHYYTPVKGDPSAADFIRFYRLPTTLFQKEATKERLYQ
jgi:hypothetical protein